MSESEKQEKRDRVVKLGDEVGSLVADLESARADLKRAVLSALASGVSENEAAKLAGITRDTVRRWAGK